jgi:hypothetical protein
MTSAIDVGRIPSFTFTPEIRARILPE